MRQGEHRDDRLDARLYQEANPVGPRYPDLLQTRSKPLDLTAQLCI
jgi:hypothetical protein